jgi:hypothetical protein
MEIETLLLTGRLPGREDCVLCGAITGNKICCMAVCETARVKYERPWWWWPPVIAMWLVVSLLSPIVVIFGFERQRPKEYGRDRFYDLPLRICSQCRLKLTDEDVVKDAMSEVPLYRRLLEKYPDAKVSVRKT